MIRDLLFFPEEIRVKIIDALKDCQNPQGYWCYPPHRKDSDFISVWTTAQAVWALLLSGTKPKFLDKAFEILLEYDTCIENGKLVGWVHESTSELGICITADSCNAFILANKYDLVENCIAKLLSIQLTNGTDKIGWGYTLSDTTCRVTATCWVVNMLLYAVQEQAITSNSVVDAIKGGINWLVSAASLDTEDGIGWGEIRGATPKVSCTSWAIYVILEAAKLGYADAKDRQITKLITGGLKTIKKLYSPQYKGWIGSPEGFRTLRMKGLGSSIVLIALVEAIDADFLEIDDIYISYALEEVESEKDGWITPSYKETQVYENVFWLLALSKLERVYLKCSKLLKSKFNALNEKYDKLLKWNIRIFSWMVIVVIGYVMYKLLTVYSNYPIIPILQSIIATLIWEFPLKHMTNAISSWSKRRLWEIE